MWASILLVTDYLMLTQIIVTLYVFDIDYFEDHVV